MGRVTNTRQRLNAERKSKPIDFRSYLAQASDYEVVEMVDTLLKTYGVYNRIKSELIKAGKWPPKKRRG